MGVTFKVEPSQLGQYEKHLSAQFKAKSIVGLVAGGWAALRHVRALSYDRVEDFTTKFNRGWHGKRISWHSYLISNVARHAKPVDLGRRPGARMPPVRALVPWVQARLGVPPRHARQVAFQVARAISRRGIRGRHILRDASSAIVRLGLLKRVDQYEHTLSNTR